MGFFDYIISKLGYGNLVKEREMILELADSVERYADRYRQADNDELAGTAENFAGQIREAGSLNQAKSLHRQFLDILRKKDQDLDGDDESDSDDVSTTGSSSYSDNS